MGNTKNGTNLLANNFNVDIYMYIYIYIYIYVWYMYVCIMIIKSGDFVGECLGPLVKIALI